MSRISSRRAKKSYTLSPESVAFLESLQRKRHADSVSAILEQILQAVRRQHEQASIEQAMADYYGSLTDDEVNEQAEWGAFALREMR